MNGWESLGTKPFALLDVQVQTALRGREAVTVRLGDRLLRYVRVYPGFGVAVYRRFKPYQRWRKPHK